MLKLGLKQSGGRTGIFWAKITVKIEGPLTGRLGAALGRPAGERERIYGGKAAAEHTVGVLGHRGTVCPPPLSTTATTSNTGSHHFK